MYGTLVSIEMSHVGSGGRGVHACVCVCVCVSALVIPANLVRNC